MKHAIYQDPITQKFALVRLPAKFALGDELPIPPVVRWFTTREEAIATLADLFNEDD